VTPSRRSDPIPVPRRFLRFRRPFIVILHLVLVAFANYAAFWLRFDGDIPDHYRTVWLVTCPWLIGIRAVMFIPFRLYEGLWRYTGIYDLRNIIGSVLVSTAAFWVGVRLGFGLSHYPRSIFIIDTVLLVFFLGGIRLSRRIVRELGQGRRDKKVLIFGAGDAGEMIVRDMKNNPFYDYEPVGFVDDDARKVGFRIHGVPVLGTRADLPAIMARARPDEMLIAMPRATPATVRGVVNALEHFKVRITTLPNLRDLLDDRVTVSQIRNLALEDLLERAPVGLDLEPVRRFVEGKRVLVTGAGGSIGTELCRQIARCEPEALILLDKAETALYEIDLEIAETLPPDRRLACLGDIKSVARMRDLFIRYAPTIVFHAAAYKHVPLMEEHPQEAVLNNIIATCRLGELAIQHGVHAFVLISTDKAVNPTSVMGATKRVAELYALARGGRPTSRSTSFCVTRFGNVLGSNGSVVPLFLRQIKEGRPVTVTHPDVTRYFMTIREAVQLVLRAAAIGRAGDILVLDMGEQIRVLDMAHHLIRLSGFVPHDEVPIVFTGLRPGEKLYEELVGADEVAVPSGVEKIMRVRPVEIPDLETLAAQIADLERLAIKGASEDISRLLQEIVPSYKSGEADRTLAPSSVSPWSLAR